MGAARNSEMLEHKPPSYDINIENKVHHEK
jgi:hypothetical protein